MTKYLLIFFTIKASALDIEKASFANKVTDSNMKLAQLNFDMSLKCRKISSTMIEKEKCFAESFIVNRKMFLAKQYNFFIGSNFQFGKLELCKSAASLSNVINLEKKDDFFLCFKTNYRLSSNGGTVYFRMENKIPKIYQMNF